MRDRDKSMQRVLAVQRQVVRLAEWRLGVLKRQCTEIKADQVRLHEFVSGGEALSPLLSAAAFTRGQSLIADGAQREEQALQQSRHTDAMRRRERLAEKLVDDLRAKADAAAEKRDLDETLEAFAQRDPASFP